MLLGSSREIAPLTRRQGADLSPEGRGEVVRAYAAGFRSGVQMGLGLFAAVGEEGDDVVGFAALWHWLRHRGGEAVAAVGAAIAAQDTDDAAAAQAGLDALQEVTR